MSSCDKASQFDTQHTNRKRPKQVLLATVLVMQHKCYIFRCKKSQQCFTVISRWKRNGHIIKLHCDARSHKDVFKCMMDQTNRSMGLQSGGYRKLLGARDPQHPQPWFARVPHLTLKPRAGAGTLPHSSTGRWSMPGAAGRAGWAGWCCGVVPHVVRRGAGTRGPLGVQSCTGTHGHACQHRALCLLEPALGKTKHLTVPKEKQHLIHP